jgi:hypothetical protein
MAGLQQVHRVSAVPGDQGKPPVVAALRGRRFSVKS